MSKLKSVMFATLISLPLMSFAGDLTLVNNTNQDSTSVINNGVCSTILGSTGITKAHSTNVVPESKINLACILNRSNCKADVYMTNNCTGKVVATVVMDTKKGIKSVDIKDKSYQIDAKDFRVELNGGA